jgi:hypothetical protein
VSWLLSVLLLIWASITSLPVRVRSIWTKREPVFRGVVAEDIPDELKPLTVYLCGEKEHLWAAAMICPCGCGDVIQLNLLQEVRPRWTAEQHRDGTVSLMPSVWRQKGCRSHFFIKHGRVEWC